MVHNVQYCDGKLFTKELLKKMLTELKHPIVFTNMINDWPSAKWTIDEFTKLFGHIMTEFKLFNRKGMYGAQKNRFAVPMETDCFYADATFNDFHAWLSNNGTNDESCGELKNYPK